MRPLLIALCVVVVGAAPALGQITGGAIGLYSDNPGASNCYLSETLYATNSIYAVHQDLTEGNTAQFMVDSGGYTAISGAVTYFANLNLGDIYTGVTITYVGCKPLPHFLAQMDWIPTSLAPACTIKFEVMPDPVLASGQIEIVDCSSNVRFANGSVLWVNGNDIDCLCGITPDTESTSWGKIKSLYQ